jgi:DNA polymerase alpha-associated DNA helicase A
MSSSSIDIAAFATRQISLLDQELAAELATTTQQVSIYAPTTLQRAGLAVLNLSVNNQRTGFGGKTLLELGLDPAVASSSDSGEPLLPQHGLRVGDICSVAEQPRGAERKKEREGMQKRGIEGVVTKVQRTALTVALDRDDADVPSGKLWL